MKGMLIMTDYIFGANILENLTTGMYKDSKVSYREYIQNACDQIDKAVALGVLPSIKNGKIEIWLSEEDRTISIEDNATGIKQSEFESTLANIADSKKQISKDKGFRGIGRLCGLAYCRELVFTSTAKGENIISEMRCNAQKMRNLLTGNINGKRITANEVLHEIYDFSYKTISGIENDHWFKVKLIDVNDENTDLLDFSQVMNYLSFTAPVPYKNTFIYQNEIYKHAKELGYRLDEYNIKLNGEDVFKNYQTYFKTSKGDDSIYGVKFKDFRNENGDLIMWLWFGLSKFKAIISKEYEMRGLRLRKENIQIGNEDALQKLFREDRGQHYFIGEVFAVSKDLIPNSQRDYFNENAMRVWFEKEMRKYFNDALYKIYCGGSEINSSFEKIDDYEKKITKHQEKINNNDYIDADDITKATEEIKKAYLEAEKKQKKIDKIKQSDNSEANEVLRCVINRIEDEHKAEKNNTVIINSRTDDISVKKSNHRTDKLSRCNKSERKLIGKIFNIIKNNIDEKNAEILITKIEEEFK
jgi:molecular chaperone HtpG